jgi:hypothetical protein
MRWPWAAVLLAIAVGVFGLTVPAVAHIPDGVGTPTVVQVTEADSSVSWPGPALTPPIVEAVPVPPAVAWSLVLALLAIPTLRSRRAVTCLLIAMLAIFAFEAGVHSVHHIGDAGEAAQCVVAAASSHLIGALGEPAAVFVATPAAIGDVATRFDLTPPPWRFARSDRGRAPPFLA